MGRVCKRLAARRRAEPRRRDRAIVACTHGDAVAIHAATEAAAHARARIGQLIATGTQIDRRSLGDAGHRWPAVEIGEPLRDETRRAQAADAGRGSAAAAALAAVQGRAPLQLFDLRELYLVDHGARAP